MSPSSAQFGPWLLLVADGGSRKLLERHNPLRVSRVLFFPVLMFSNRYEFKRYGRQISCLDDENV